MENKNGVTGNSSGITVQWASAHYDLISARKILRIWNKNERGVLQTPIMIISLWTFSWCIDRSPTGFVHITYPLWIGKSSCLHTILLLGVEPLWGVTSQTKSWKSGKINLDFMFWFDVDEQIKNDHFCIFLLHNWNLQESVYEKLIFTKICIRITVGISTIVVDPVCTHFNDKINMHIGLYSRWNFIHNTKHSVWSNI